MAAESHLERNRRSNSSCHFNDTQLFVPAMPPSILGKRARASNDISHSAIFTRGKRRIQIFDEAAETENLFTARSTSTAAQYVGLEPFDESSTYSFRKTRPQRARTVPAKHGPAGGRVSISLTAPRPQDSKIASTYPEENVDCENPQIPTPRTPKRRGNVENKVPVTPKHRVFVTGKLLTPQSNRKSSTKPKATSSIYSEARKLFTRGANTGRLVGRESERHELQEFVSEHLESMHGGSAYVSGPPGTGKSALVSEICDNIQRSETLSKAYVNCMSASNEGDIYRAIAVDLGLSEDTSSADSFEDGLRSVFTTASETNTLYLLILDEIDQLLTVGLNALYNLFEWSLQPKSRLILIGIANALDFTERFLPRLKSRNLVPNLIPFLPYTASEISSVLTTRLRLLLESSSVPILNFVPVLHPAAIQLISRKVASQSGDLRKAFDIARSVIDLIEGDTMDTISQLQTPSPSKRPLADNPNLSSPCSMSSNSPTKEADFCKPSRSTLGNLTAETAPRGTLAHVTRITSAAFGNGTSQRLKSLNLQQKAILCSLAALERKIQEPRHDPNSADPFATPSRRTGTAPTIRSLFNAYTKFCKMDNVLHPLTNSEFRDVLGSLESLTLVTSAETKIGSFVIPVTPSRSGRKRNPFGGAAHGDDRRIAGVVSLQELEALLEGAGIDILRYILSSDLSH